MKVLFVSHLANFQKFNIPFISWLRENGCQVDYASLDDEVIENIDSFHKIDFRRSPYNPVNIKALFQLISLLRREKYDLIHCHTPIGGILTRLAAMFSKKTKVIYTAHGFHFFNGAPKINFIVYRTAEKLLAHRTDGLVTINDEDYEAAKNFHLRKGGKLYHLRGVGVDTKAIASENPDKIKLRRELGILPDSFVVLTVAELIVRKNYPVALKAFAEANIPNSVYLICGCGTEEENLKKITEELNIADKVIFAGYRRDIRSIVKISDVFLFTTTQEGLPIALLEAMAGGLPAAASRVRGNSELVTDNGILLDKNDVEGFAAALKTLYDNPLLAKSMGEVGIRNAKPYDTANAVQSMAHIYHEVCGKLFPYQNHS